MSSVLWGEVQFFVISNSVIICKPFTLFVRLSETKMKVESTFGKYSVSSKPIPQIENYKLSSISLSWRVYYSITIMVCGLSLSQGD